MAYTPTETAMSNRDVPIPTQLIGDPVIYPGSDNPVPADSFIAEAYGQAQRVTARVTANRNPALFPPGQDVASGSGVVVSPGGEVVTDKHVTQGAQSIQLRLNGSNYAGQVVAQDALSDLAVVQIDKQFPNQTFPYAALAPSSQLASNQSLGAYGYPEGSRQLYFSPATYSQRLSMSDIENELQGGLMPGENPWRQILELNGKASPGNSGGPVFQAASDQASSNQAGKLQLVALVDLSNTVNHIDATPVEDIRAFLSQIPGNQYYRQPAETVVAGNQPLYGWQGRPGQATAKPFAALSSTDVQAPYALPVDTNSGSGSVSMINRGLQYFQNMLRGV